MADREQTRRDAEQDVEIERPPIKRGCFRCGVRWDHVQAARVVVSPKGTAHFGETGGNTSCGIDATGDKWWWPL